MKNEATNCQLKKKAMLLSPETLKHALKGFGTGFLGLSAVYGMSELAKAVANMTASAPKIPRKIYVDIVKEKQEEEEDRKRMGLRKAGADDSMSRIGQGLAYGFGLVPGVWGAYQLFKHLNKAQRNIDYIKKMKELEDVYESKFMEKEREKQAMVQSYRDGFCKAANECMQKNAGKWAGWEYYPALLGATVPLGFLAGYYGLKNYMPIPEEEEMIVPELAFRHIMLAKKKKQAQERAEEETEEMEEYEEYFEFESEEPAEGETRAVEEPDDAAEVASVEAAKAE